MCHERFRWDIRKMFLTVMLVCHQVTEGGGAILPLAGFLSSATTKGTGDYS